MLVKGVITYQLLAAETNAHHCGKMLLYLQTDGMHYENHNCDKVQGVPTKLLLQNLQMLKLPGIQKKR